MIYYQNAFSDFLQNNDNILKETFIGYYYCMLFSLEFRYSKTHLFLEIMTKVAKTWPNFKIYMKMRIQYELCNLRAILFLVC